ncbi:MAG: PAS domain S-box protein [Halodesulfurarchaeum sp.]
MTAGTEDIDVLVVDDEPDYPELMARRLEDADALLSVETASSVEAGIEAVETGSFECVVADYDFPERNGIEFLRSVREVDPSLPFVLLTGKGSEGIASEAIGAGVTDYFRKRQFPEQYPVLANRIVDAAMTYRAEKELESRRRELQTYERLVHSMLAPACIYDEDHRFVLVNEYLAEWYGTSREELEGEKSNLIPLIREQYDGDPYQQLLDGDLEKLTGTVEAAFPDHGYAILEYNMSPLRVDGSIEGVVSVTRDVTERVERERELEQAFEEYQELFDGMNDTAWVIDTDGEFLAVNDAAVHELGYSREEFESMNPHDIDEGLEPAEIDSLIDDMPEDERQVFETVHRRKDGSTIPVEISSSLITYGGTEAILSIARDITERKEREERLEQFASVVSHDLRNPLNVAQGRLEMVQEECDSDHLAAIEQAHDRMQSLIEDLLELARMGEPVTDTERVELASLIEESWQGVETESAEIHIETEHTIEADESRLRQVFENLIRNAIEHDGEDVEITAGDLENGFFVEDDGTGIPEDRRRAVFEAGYSTDEDGTGLGLSIVEGIVEAHGWDITIVEGESGGARFEITGVDSIEN